MTKRPRWWMLTPRLTSKDRITSTSLLICVIFLSAETEDEERILPLHDADAGPAEGIPQGQEEKWAGRSWISSCGHQLLQLLLLFSLQSLLVHDVGRQRWAAAVGHRAFQGRTTFAFERDIWQVLLCVPGCRMAAVGAPCEGRVQRAAVWTEYI